MGQLVRWVIFPAVLITLAVLWQYRRFAKDVAENCDPNCITSGEIAVWRATLVAALILWIVVLAVHFLRDPPRRRRRLWPFGQQRP